MDNTLKRQSMKTLSYQFSDRINIISDLNLSDERLSVKRLEAFSVMLCTQGEADVFLNNREIHLQAGQLLSTPLGTLVEVSYYSSDLKLIGFYLSRQFFEELNAIPLGMWGTSGYIEEHPVTSLDAGSMSLFCNYYELIHSKLNTERPLEHHQLVVTLLFQAFMYELHDALAGSLAVRMPRYTSGDNIFKQFSDLLIQTYPRPRSGKWYAAHLNVTAKYLSTVCKQNCGHTASQLINRYVVEDVKRLLMRPEKSIKQIVVELECPSISFFGKFVKKHLGMAPKFYRRQL